MTSDHCTGTVLANICCCGCPVGATRKTRELQEVLLHDSAAPHEAKATVQYHKGEKKLHVPWSGQKTLYCPHYKVATLCYNSFTESYPVYLSELMTVYRPSRQLRSISDTRTFRIPFTKTFGQRAFSFTGPTEWNSLPYDVRHSASTSSFKQALKTHLFKSAYN